jgi:hypothetical protein
MRRSTMLAALVLLSVAAPARGQELADFDYENLSFRGVGIEWGYLWANKVEPTPTYGVRMDLGYLGPGLRITPSLTYWTSRMKRSEVTSLEDRLASLVASQQPPGSPAPVVDLEPIDWSDLALALDAHVVWRTPYVNAWTFAGAGAAVHFMDGSGPAINNTFIEDLLDSVGAGFDLHAGAEYAVQSNIRVYGMGRLELLQDVQFIAIRFGAQLQLGPGGGEEESPR